MVFRYGSTKEAYFETKNHDCILNRMNDMGLGEYEKTQIEFYWGKRVSNEPVEQENDHQAEMIEYHAVTEKFHIQDIIHSIDYSSQVVLDNHQLPIYINPELVNSKQQIYQLREILQHWICGHHAQYLTAFHPIERSRQIVGLLHYLLQTQYIHRAFICSHSSGMLDDIAHTFKLHTDIEPAYLIEQSNSHYSDAVERIFRLPIYLGRYQDFLNIYGTKDLGDIFAQFDLIVIDEADLEQNQLWQVVMQKYYRGWRWYIHLELPKQIIVA